MFAAKDTLLTRPSGAAYEISRSLRFNSADSAYLNRTFTTPTSNTTWSFSFWLKRSTLATQQYFLNVDSYSGIGTNNDSIVFWSNAGITLATSTAVFRDVSAWYHVVVISNGTTITAYVNNSSVLSYTGTITNLNSAVVHNIGRDQTSNSAYLNGYMTEINFIDGQALTPSSFGSTNAQTGVWQPKKFAGTYGTNGFYLNFSDNSNTTAATLGADYSGNGNNWTPTGFSVSAGAGNDSLVDSPTSYGTDTGVGGTVRGNYCTLNPLDKSTSGGAAKNGNLDYAGTQASWDMIRSTFGMSSGKWYWEVSVNSSALGITGIAQASVVLQNNYFSSGACLGYNAANGDKYSGTGGATAYGASWNASNDICGVAFDADAGTLTFYKNGTSQGVAYTSLSGTYFPAHTLYDTSTATLNFGQRPFAYTAPSGFKALCTQNLPTPTVGATSATLATKYFNPVIYTGAGGSQTVTGVGFQPDWVWMKSRSNSSTNHILQNAVTGVTKGLQSNLTDPEFTDSTTLTAFNSDGFTVGGNSQTNLSTYTYVAWNWKANGAGSSNTAGSITSTVSASTTSGFSVVTYTGTGANATVGHGIGVAPSMVIIKARSFTQVWVVGHSSIGFGNYLLLNATDASASGSNVFNSTAPTSTVFSLGSGGGGNQSAATYVAYCFAPIEGYSAFGSYTGNGSADGPFVYTGFRPACIIFKVSDGSASWLIHDNKRNTNNVVDKKLFPNLSDAEATADVVDFLSNGFKLRGTNTQFNGNGYNYIFAAFAENPFKFSLAR